MLVLVPRGERRRRALNAANSFLLDKPARSRRKRCSAPSGLFATLAASAASAASAAPASPAAFAAASASTAAAFAAASSCASPATAAAASAAACSRASLASASALASCLAASSASAARDSALGGGRLRYNSRYLRAFRARMTTCYPDRVETGGPYFVPGLPLNVA